MIPAILPEMKPVVIPVNLKYWLDGFAMIRFPCPSCGQMIKVPDAAAGKTGKCKCGELVRIADRNPVIQSIEKENKHSEKPNVTQVSASSPAVSSNNRKQRNRIVRAVLAIVAVIVAILTLSGLTNKPEISTSTLDFHAGTVNKLLYQKDDLVKEMDKEIGTSLSSHLSPEVRDRIDAEELDHAGSKMSMRRYTVKFDILKKEMDDELKALMEKVNQYRRNDRLNQLVTELQQGRDKVDGIINSLFEKVTQRK